MDDDAVTIRPLEGIEEYSACVALQEETWGNGFSERVPPAILKVAQILGGVSAGAWNAQGELMGFVFGMTGLRDGELVHWSDMLAVRTVARDGGLGTRLKAHQRDEVLRRGVEKMFWTFDPLQSRNAHVNFNKLGVVVREYVENMYGETDSPLHRGIGTDRFVALWLLSSPRVRTRLDAALSGRAARAERGGGGSRGGVAPPAALQATVSGGHPRPGGRRLDLDEATVAVHIPSDIVSLMNDDMALAREWRDATRSVLRHYLDRGYEVRELTRRGPTSTYAVSARREEVQ